MMMRKIVSLTAFLSGTGLFISGIILYLAPQGRVAYWSDWRFLFLSKTQWTDLHINLGYLFLCSAILHTYYNWNALMRYLKRKTATLLKFSTVEFNISLLLLLWLLVGTFFHLPPFSWIQDVNAYLQKSAADSLGEPPYGHAELSSLEGFCRKVGLDINRVIERFREAGFENVSGSSVLVDIARTHNVSPKHIYEIIKNCRPIDPSDEASQILPLSPSPGLGRLTVEEFCRVYHIPFNRLATVLNTKGITFTESTTIKACAEQAYTAPSEFYDIIRNTLSSMHIPEGEPTPF